MKIFLNGSELIISHNSISDKIIDYTQEIEEKNIKKVSRVINMVGNYAKKTYVSSSGIKMFAGVVGVNDDSFYNIVTKLQDFSFYIAVGWATWGIIEYILDKPQGVEKIKRAVWGYIGINAIPTLFAMIRDTFRMTNAPTPSKQSLIDIDNIREFLG
jgi:hypothetical protein